MTRRERGFTLIELMVVIGIIALLLGFLIPSLSTARQRAVRTQCLNNIREIGLAITIYANDNKELPPAETTSPPWYSKRTGLLVLRGDDSVGSRSTDFSRKHLVCPQGWASAGNSNWYASAGLSSSGAAYMDYIYWGRRFVPSDNDIRYDSFVYRSLDGATKILVTDTVVNLDAPPKQISQLGNGNHWTAPSTVAMTDGYGHRLPPTYRVGSTGGCVLFSDGSARWFDASKWTQNTGGLCYPPVDQW